ncbi:unnamed protein product [Rotaria sp. Silwood2]|nr:unnamed protein product [Rotaria sp. Silwood2]CAF3119202.1 unnamed protein product [Rotaria sp. Silwood2]CAF4451365.1 unnamed protein product [Rotaria sp. Silwood2]CAF4707019.1 unnamed protein product [Rotaria sp. Silwood2]
MAQTQEFASIPDSDCKSKGEPSSTYVKQQQIQMDDQYDNRQGQISIQQPTEIMSVSQQLLVKQVLVLYENTQLKQDIATQGIILNNHSQAIEALQGTKISCLHMPVTNPCSTPMTAFDSELTTSVMQSAKLSLKGKAFKQLQSKRIDQLLNFIPFS